MNTLQISKHKIVTFTYSISDEAGKAIEQSGVPLEYIHGMSDNQMFPKVEQALDGKKVGDTVSVTLSPEEGFGQHDPDMTYTDDIDNIPAEYRFVGAKPTFQNELGESMQLTVSKIENGKLTLDANHPFSGKTITFNIQILAIRDATETELSMGASSPPSSATLQ